MVVIDRTYQVSRPESDNEKSYAVNMRGLITHLLDVVSHLEDKSQNYSTEGLSEYIQKDVGLMK